MKIKKFPVISKFGNKYLVKLERYNDGKIGDMIRCTIYKKFLFLNFKKHSDYVYIGSLSSLKLFTERVVDTYEYSIGYRNQPIHHSLEEFEKWNGDMRE